MNKMCDLKSWAWPMTSRCDKHLCQVTINGKIMDTTINALFEKKIWSSCISFEVRVWLWPLSYRLNTLSQCETHLCQVICKWQIIEHYYNNYIIIDLTQSSDSGAQKLFAPPFFFFLGWEWEGGGKNVLC